MGTYLESFADETTGRLIGDIEALLASSEHLQLWCSYSILSPSDTNHEHHRLFPFECAARALPTIGPPRPTRPPS